MRDKAGDLPDGSGSLKGIELLMGFKGLALGPFLLGVGVFEFPGTVPHEFFENNAVRQKARERNENQNRQRPVFFGELSETDFTQVFVGPEL